MSIIQDGLRTLVQNGLVELLVFILVFAIVFGVLNNINLFGGEDYEKRKYNVLIALVFGALTIVPSIVAPGSRYDVIPIIKNALPQTMLVLVAIVCIIILLGLFGLNKILDDVSWAKPIVAVVAIGIIIYIFMGASGTLWRLPYWLTPDWIAVIIALLVFGIIVYFVMGSDDDKSAKSP